MAAETPKSYKEKVVAAAVEKVRSDPFKSKEVKEITENWVKKIFDITPEQNDRIGVLWITEILGSDEDTLARFREDVVNDEIGLKHSGSVDYKANSRAFWKGVQEVAPALVREEDLEFLIENDQNGSAAWALIICIGELYPRVDFLTTKIVSNVRIYK